MIGLKGEYSESVVFVLIGARSIDMNEFWLTGGDLRETYGFTRSSFDGKVAAPARGDGVYVDDVARMFVREDWEAEFEFEAIAFDKFDEWFCQLDWD